MDLTALHHEHPEDRPHAMSVPTPDPRAPRPTRRRTAGSAARSRYGAVAAAFAVVAVSGAVSATVQDVPDRAAARRPAAAARPAPAVVPPVSGVPAMPSVPSVPSVPSAPSAPSGSPATPPGRPAPAVPTAVPVSALTQDGIPTAALTAYRRAARLADAARPGCGIAWPLVAAIGRVESDHGRFAGAVLHADGVSTPGIVGIALDGNGTEVVRDTDGGRLDGDRTWDRAVGPMQFIPSTWATWAVDAGGDGTADPDDLDDAAAATADYLCAAGGDLTTYAGQRRAVLTYNHSEDYLRLVLALERTYGAGVVAVPTAPGRGDATVLLRPTPTAPRTVAAAPARTTAAPSPTPTPSPTPRPTSSTPTSPRPSTSRTPTPTGTPTPACPTPTGTPSPTPTPTSSPTPSPTGTACPTPTPTPSGSSTTPTPTPSG